MAPKIGSVVYTDPRAVQVNGKYIEGIDDEDPHSTIHGSISILVNSKSEADAVMAAWPAIIESVDREIRAIRTARLNDA